MKKRNTYEKEVERELKETAAQAERKELAKTHTAILRMLFTTYFRFLKQNPGTL